MTGLLTLAGLIVGVVLFLNLLQAKDRTPASESEANGKNGAGPNGKGGSNGRIAKATDRRICPVCRTGLTPDEYLICAMGEDLGPGTKRQVHIYGCPHCFLTDGVNLKRYEQLKDF